MINANEDIMKFKNSNGSWDNFSAIIITQKRRYHDQSNKITPNSLILFGFMQTEFNQVMKIR